MLLSLIGLAAALTLEDAWKAAGAESQEAAILDEQRVQAGTIRTQAWATLSPKLTLNGNWTRNQREVALNTGGAFPPELLAMIETFTGEPLDLGEPTVIQKLSFFDANVSVVQPVFSARALPALRGALALDRAAEAQRDVGMGQLRLGVARAYWGVIVAREGAQLATEGLALAQKHAETVGALVASGSATRQAELQAAMAVARAERELAGAAARKTQAEAAFAALVEVGPDVVLELPASRDLGFVDVDAVLAAARSRRPELRAARAQEDAARATSLAAHLAWVPNVDARFTQAWTENTGFSGETSTWLVVLNASWTAWDGGFRVAEQDRASSQRRMAAAATEKAAQDAEVEIRAAWEEHVRARRAFAAAERELALAEENLRLAEVSHAAGVSTFVDLEDARMSRDAVRLSVMVERMGADLAVLTLRRAVSGNVGS
jgi:outer membrane protein TolC